MAPKLKNFTTTMKIVEIAGQRVLTTVVDVDENNLSDELFVKNIPEHVNEDDLIPFFETVGPLFSFRLMMNEKKTKTRGFLYLVYAEKTHAKIALSKLNNSYIRGNKISIEPSLNNCRIFVGGIPVDKSKDEIWNELIKQGVQNIVDVIVYRSYTNRAINRGFVFVEFPSHKMAAQMRCRHKNLVLWGQKAVVDWSVPQYEPPKDIMNHVRILFLRNLNVLESRDDLRNIIQRYITLQKVTKIYKFKNYAFVHLTTRHDAEYLLHCLKYHFKDSHVEICFSKPPSTYTKPEFRKLKMTKIITPTTSSESIYNFDAISEELSSIAYQNYGVIGGEMRKRRNDSAISSDSLSDPDGVFAFSLRDFDF